MNIVGDEEKQGKEFSKSFLASGRRRKDKSSNKAKDQMMLREMKTKIRWVRKKGVGEELAFEPC